MTTGGHSVERVDGVDRYVDTGEVAFGPDSVPRPCVLCHREPVWCIVPDPGWSGDGLRWMPKPIDACIADIVVALCEMTATQTRTSCCGHGTRPGWILLLDGRRLELPVGGRR
jgi:hypothetical protein